MLRAGSTRRHTIAVRPGIAASGTRYDVRWAVIITGNATTASSKRIILGIRQVGGNGYFQPITLDTMVVK